MKRLLAPVTTALLAVAIAIAGPAAADVTDVSGSGAFGVSVNATVIGGPGVNIGPVPSVDLPAGGGSVDDDLASVEADPILMTGLLEVSSEGGDLGSHAGFATSTASVADVVALEVLEGVLDDPLLTAELITAECTSNGDGSSGDSELLAAELAGNPIDVSLPPNTAINLLGGAVNVVLNEQIVTNTPGVETKITVNAVHITVNVGGLVTADVIISQARCRAAGPDVLNGAPPDGGPGDGGPGDGGPGDGAGPAGPARPAAPVSAAPTRLTG